jgi:hypothetical protein
MNGIAILDSGNFALKLCSILEKKGYIFEVVSTPCHIAKNGCSYCLKFPIEFADLIISEGSANNIAVREIYKVVNQVTRNKYERVL